jgi:hypothetical protein
MILLEGFCCTEGNRGDEKDNRYNPGAMGKRVIQLSLSLCDKVLVSSTH